MPRVKSFKSIGLQQAYDIEVAHPDHQFYLANGLLTSNSHAVSYAIDSYQCAWLLTYSEPEWLCAYMESQNSSPESRSEAINTLKGFGYETIGIDINYALETWTIMPGKKFMPSLLSVKGVGISALEEIKLYRPYNTVEDLLWNPDGSWRHSKFNKRALENLIKLGAFNSMGIVGEGKVFPSYKAMHACLCEDNTKLKHKKKGQAVLKERIALHANTKEWSDEERVAFSKELLGSFDVELVLPAKLRDKLNEIGVPPIDEFDPNRKPALYWFIAESVEVKNTRNGKEYVVIGALALTGKKHRINCWNYDKTKHEIGANSVFVAELELSQWGFSTNAWKMRHVIKRNS